MSQPKVFDLNSKITVRVVDYPGDRGDDEGSRVEIDFRLSSGFKRFGLLYEGLTSEQEAQALAEEVAAALLSYRTGVA